MYSAYTFHITNNKSLCSICGSNLSPILNHHYIPRGSRRHSPIFIIANHYYHYGTTQQVRVSFPWPSALPTLCSTHCSHVNAILPNSRTLDGYTLRQNWSATVYTIFSLTHTHDISSQQGVGEGGKGGVAPGSRGGVASSRHLAGWHLARGGVAPARSLWPTLANKTPCRAHPQQRLLHLQ